MVISVFCLLVFAGCPRPERFSEPLKSLKASFDGLSQITASTRDGLILAETKMKYISLFEEEQMKVQKESYRKFLEKHHKVPMLSFEEWFFQDLEAKKKDAWPSDLDALPGELEKAKSVIGHLSKLADTKYEEDYGKSWSEACTQLKTLGDAFCRLTDDPKQKAIIEGTEGLLSTFVNEVSRSRREKALQAYLEHAANVFEQGGQIILSVLERRNGLRITKLTDYSVSLKSVLGKKPPNNVQELYWLLGEIEGTDELLRRETSGKGAFAEAGKKYEAAMKALRSSLTAKRQKLTDDESSKLNEAMKALLESLGKLYEATR